MPGRRYIELLELAQERRGFLTPDDARELGMDPAILRVMHHRGTLERPARGVYRLPTIAPGPLDEYMQAVLWPDGVLAVLSHETALDRYELSDINPGKIHLTVPRRHRPQRAVPELYVLHRRDLDRADITNLNGLPIVTVRKSIADCIDADVRSGLIEQAIDQARNQAQLTRADADALRKQLVDHLSLA